MKPAERGLRLERQKRPLEFNTYGPGQSHRRVCTEDGCASSPSEAAAGAQALAWAGDAQEPSIQANGPAWGQTERSAGQGGPGQLDALAGRAGWEGAGARAGTSGAGIKRKLVVCRILKLPSITAMGAAVRTAAQTKGRDPWLSPASTCSKVSTFIRLRDGLAETVIQTEQGQRRDPQPCILRASLLHTVTFSHFKNLLISLHN